jgi:hypothetical protein
MMSPANMASWWLQSGAIFLAALALPRMLRLRHFRSELLLMQLVLLACLSLPLAQPWRREVPGPAASPGPVHVLTPAAPPPQAPRVDWTRWVVPIAAAGAAIRLLWLAVGLWRLRRYRRMSRPFEGRVPSSARPCLSVTP